MSGCARQDEPGKHWDTGSFGGGLEFTILRRGQQSPHGFRELPSLLNVSSFHLVHQIVTRPDAKRHDRDRGILTSAGGKSRTVTDEQILDVVSLLELVEDRSLGIVPHSGDPNLVDPATWFTIRNGKRPDIFRPGRFHHSLA